MISGVAVSCSVLSQSRVLFQERSRNQFETASERARVDRNTWSALDRAEITFYGE